MEQGVHGGGAAVEERAAQVAAGSQVVKDDARDRADDGLVGVMGGR